MTFYRRIEKRTTVLLTIFLSCLAAGPSCLTALGEASVIPPRVVQPVDSSNLITLGGNTHPRARPEYDRGAAPDSLPMDRILLVLQRSAEQEAVLRRLLEEQQVMSSPNYHQWLTPEQFGKQFGPADADIQAVTDWLTTQGFQVNRVAAGRTVIEFSGTAGLVRQALHTEIHRFVVKGEEHWANSSDPQIPAALRPVVAGIVSLNNFPRRPMHVSAGSFRRSKATGNVEPLFTFTSQRTVLYALGPTDFATIYNVLPLWQAGTDGAGETIAIVGQTNINIQDARDFRKLFGLPASDPQVVLDGPDPGITGDETEADLDTQWAGAVARNATIKLVVSESTESSAGIDLSALYIIDNNIAPVMSESYGACEVNLGGGGNAFYNTLWEQGAAQGITVVVGAGDNGSAACDDVPGEDLAVSGLGVNGIASTPFNVAVGGTDFDDASNPLTYWNATNSSPSESSAKSYIPETAWNDSCARLGLTSCAAAGGNIFDLAAGGGGPSTCGVSQLSLAGTCLKGYAKPSWQTGAGVPKDGVRDMPDVSLFAGNGLNGSFYVICQADANPTPNTSCDLKAPYMDFQGIGGTSAGTPSFAAIMALVNQHTGERQGDANYVLYKLAAQKSASCASNAAAVTDPSCIFYDVIHGNNSVACSGGSPNCSNKNTNGSGVIVEPASASKPAWPTGAGYDLATGLGSVNAENLVEKWTSIGFTPSSTTLTSLSPTTVTHGQPVNVSIKVSSTSGTPSGEVSLMGGPSNSDLGIADFTLRTGVASGSTSLLPGGTYTVTAHYGGDGTFGASSSSPPLQVTVNKESSKTQVGLVTFDFNTGLETSSDATTAPYGSPYVLRSNITNSSGQECSLITAGPIPCPTGVVTVSANGKPLGLGKYALNSQGYTEDELIQLGAGSYNVEASYGGDSSFVSSSSGTVPISISKGFTFFGPLTASPTPVPFGENVTLTATVNTQSSGVAPTGTVQFLNGSTPLSGTVTYSGMPASSSISGLAMLQATLVAGLSKTLNITLKYSGDANYLSAASPVTVKVAPGFTQAISPASISIAAPGQPGMASITVKSGGGFSGAIAFTCAVPATMKEASCSANPPSVMTSGNTTLAVTTTAAHTVGALFNGPRVPLAPSVAAVIFVILLGFAARVRRWNLAYALFLAALAAAGFGACGGGGGGGGGSTNDPGTPAGVYTIVVTGSGGSVFHATSVSVNIQ